MTRTVGLWFAGGVLGAVAATALATGVAPAPARALDACVSSALGTMQTGSASCSSSGRLSLAIAVGANTSAIVAGGLFNLALAVGDNSVANTTPGVRPTGAELATATTATATGYSNFTVATGWLGGEALASEGNFNIATAVLGGSLAASGGSRGAIGNFAIAQAFGNGAIASAGADTDERDQLIAVDSSFASARAFGKGAQAVAGNGRFALASAIGAGAQARALNGSAQIARALGEGSRAYAFSGNFNVAGVIGKGSSARAGGNGANLSGGNNRNSALVWGNSSTATSCIALDAPAGTEPVSGRHVLIIGNGKTKSDKAAATSSKPAANA